MGLKPHRQDPEIKSLTVRIIPLEGGAFYHFGTGSDMLQSMLQIQNRVLDQRAIWSRNVKPHPSIFVQNAITGPFSGNNRHIWIENACIPASWSLHNCHILTGIPEFLESGPGTDQNPSARWLPDQLFTRPEYLGSMLLYYTGITRVAKNILAEIVRGMFLNSGKHLEILREMKGHAKNTFTAIQANDYGLLAGKIRQSWLLNCRLDEGTNPPNSRARLVGMTLSSHGFQLTRS